jgi:uncharacterized membrane protein
MKELMIAYCAGAVSGSRSMLGLALAARSAPARTLALGLAAAELVADKSPRVPNRTDPIPLAGRMLTGALAGAACARNGNKLPTALAGAAGALTGTYVFFYLRRLATERLGAPPLAAALTEDAMAVGSGMLVRRCR